MKTQYDEMGRELPDPTPVEIPLRFRGSPESLADSIKRFVRQELSVAAHSKGWESFEEANDFEMDDDEVMTKYEHMGEEVPIERDNPIDRPRKRGASRVGETAGRASSGDRAGPDRAGGRARGGDAGDPGASGVEHGTNAPRGGEGRKPPGEPGSADRNVLPGGAREPQTR